MENLSREALIPLERRSLQSVSTLEMPHHDAPDLLRSPGGDFPEIRQQAQDWVTQRSWRKFLGLKLPKVDEVFAAMVEKKA